MTNPEPRARVLSTEPSTEQSQREAAAAPQASARCNSCNAAIAPDQRYCLECGERLAPISGFLLGRRPDGASAQASAPPASPPGVPPAADAAKAPRSNLLGVLAGVGVLLLAMGVGVLIGRAGNSNPAPAKAQVITQVAPPTATGTASPATTFTSDWPASRHGYAVQLSALPTSTTVVAVTAAKTAATTKGAPAVGALDSGEFSSLPSGSYVIYSGVYHSSAQARSALGKLRGKFPGAKVIHVASAGAGAAGAGAASSGGSSSHAPSSITHPAPPSVLNGLKRKGKGYVEASKNLPDVVETG